MKEALMHQAAQEPKLEAPGAGISVIEMLALNWLIKPIRIRNSGASGAIELLKNSTTNLDKLLKQINTADWTTKVLVDRPWFVEDSSRNWSAAMLFRHLTKVDGALARAIDSGFVANAEHLPEPSERLAAVKPEQERNDLSAVHEFQKSVVALIAAIEKHPEEDLKRRKLAHPWLGEISHLQWAWFAGFHHKIHLKQLEKIASGLKGRP